MTPGKDSSDASTGERRPAESAAPAERGQVADRRDEHHEPISETVGHAARSEDRPMERKTPQVPFALVGLSYFTVLAVILLIIAIVLFWLSR